MQDFLTLTIEAIATVSVAYLAIGFILTVRAHAPAAVELPTQDEVDDVMERLTIAAALLEMEPAAVEVAAVAIVAAIAPAWAALNPEQLRKECSARAIKWRNAHGKNRHMKKAEMVAALGAIAV
jgi:hypothetical protein